MPSRSPRPRETTLYGAVKHFLEARGFEVKGEIGHCDVVAVREGEPPLLVISELKLGFSLELVLQGIERMRAADEVWLAVQATRRGRDRDGRAHRLCRMLGFGMLAVTPSTGRVDILAEPTAYRPRPDPRRRRLLLREHAARIGDPTEGGRARGPIMTAYRQQALACAHALSTAPLKVATLRKLAPEAGAILLRNWYGWFERESRGVYRLTPAGHSALAMWPDANGAGDLPQAPVQPTAASAAPRDRLAAVRPDHPSEPEGVPSSGRGGGRKPTSRSPSRSGPGSAPP